MTKRGGLPRIYVRHCEVRCLSDRGNLTPPLIKGMWGGVIPSSTVIPPSVILKTPYCRRLIINNLFRIQAFPSSFWLACPATAVVQNLVLSLRGPTSRTELCRKQKADFTLRIAWRNWTTSLAPPFAGPNGGKKNNRR